MAISTTTQSHTRRGLLALSAASALLIAGCANNTTADTTPSATAAGATTAAAAASAPATTQASTTQAATTAAAAEELDLISARPKATADDPSTFTPHPTHPGGILFTSPDGKATCQLFDDDGHTAGGCLPTDTGHGGGTLDGRTPPAGAFVTEGREQTLSPVDNVTALAKGHSVTFGDIQCTAISDSQIRCDHLGTGDVAVFDDGLIITDPSTITDSTGAHTTTSRTLDFFFDPGDTRATLTPVGTVDPATGPTRLALDMDTQAIARIDAPATNGGDGADANALLLDFSTPTPTITKAMGNAAGGSISQDIQRDATYRSGPFLVDLTAKQGLKITDLRTGGTVTITDTTATATPGTN